MFKTVQNKLFLNFSLATALVFLSFGSIYAWKGRYFLGVFELLLGIALVLNIAYLYYIRKEKVSYRILVGSVHVMSYIIFLTGGLGDTGFLWIEFIPIFTMLILNHKESLFWIWCYSSLLISAIFYNCFVKAFLVYSNIQIIQSIVVYLLFLYLTYNNEKLKALARDRLEKQNHDLKKMSRTDSLTLLYNRSFINHILNHEFNRFDRYNLGFSLIMLDIDHFKQVNDSFGHQTGDRVLTVIAETLRSNTRKTDFVGRWGGEEFLIVCTETSLEDAGALAEKLRSIVSTITFEDGFSVTISSGVAEILKGKSIKELISESDFLLYESKHNGRNRVTVMNPDLKELYKRNQAPYHQEFQGDTELE